MRTRQFARIAMATGACMLALAASALAVEFSAESVTSFSGGGTSMQQKGKIYVSGKKYRTDVKMQGMNEAIIVRPDKGLAWRLMPKSKQYMEMKGIKPGMMTPGKGDAELLKVATKKKLGKQKVGKFLCDKILYTFKDKKRGTLTQWYSPELKWAIKTQGKSQRGTMTTEYKNIKVGKVPASVFEVPKGYKKIAMPAGPPPGANGRPRGPMPGGQMPPKPH